MIEIDRKQNVYKFRGNNYPYIFFSVSSSNGFIKNDYFYKEAVVDFVDGEKRYNYTKSNFKVYEENSKIFRHIVNFAYYILMGIVLYSAYVTNTLLMSIVFGTILGFALKYLIQKGDTILIFGAMLLSIGSIIYLLNIGTTDAPFAIFFYAVLFYQIYENLTSDDLIYRIDSKPNGYYIWTDGKPVHKVEDMLDKKASDDGYVMANIKEKTTEEE